MSVLVESVTVEVEYLRNQNSTQVLEEIMMLMQNKMLRLSKLLHLYQLEEKTETVRKQLPTLKHLLNLLSLFRLPYLQLK
jgi:hypothetical protein